MPPSECVAGALIMKRVETGPGQGEEAEGLASLICKGTGQRWVKKRESRAEKGQAKQHRSQQVRFLQRARSEERKHGEREVDSRPCGLGGREGCRGMGEGRQERVGSVLLSSYAIRAADENSHVQPLPGTRNLSLSVSHLTINGGLDSPLITEEAEAQGGGACWL